MDNNLIPKLRAVIEAYLADHKYQIVRLYQDKGVDCPCRYCAAARAVLREIEESCKQEAGNG